MFPTQHSMCEQVVVVLSLVRYHSLGDALLTGDMAPLPLHSSLWTPLFFLAVSVICWRVQAR